MAGRLDAAGEFVENTIDKEMAKFERLGLSSQKKDREECTAKLCDRLELYFCALVFPVEQIWPSELCRIIMVNKS